MLVFEILSTLFVFLITLLIWRDIMRKRKEPKNFPPGPRSYIPWVGGMAKVGLEPHKAFLEMRKKWGNIFAYDLGPKRIIAINHYKTIKETLRLLEFNGRMKTKAIDLMRADENPSGILINSDIKSWEENRRFTMKNLRDFGFGKKSIESHLALELREVIENFKRSKGQPILIKHNFTGAVVNSVWAILLGSRYEQQDPLIVDLYQRITEDVTSAAALIYFPIFFKLYDWLPLIFPFVGKYIENRKYVMGYMKKLVQDHKEKFDPNSIKDFIDIYLLEIEKEKNPNSTFYGKTGETHLITIVHDLFIAGSETSSTALSWACHLIALYPEIQAKAHQEIESVVGVDRFPNLMDRNSLPFTEALIYEVLRFACVVPIGPHEISNDVTYEGFFFPKGTFLLINMWACLHDPDYWGDPQNFRPERFLSPDGTKLIKHEPFIPFATGKRQCLGESLARDTLFLFITTIIQRFKIYPDPARPTPKEIKTNPGGTILPVSFPLIFEDILG